MFASQNPAWLRWRKRVAIMLPAVLTAGVVAVVLVETAPEAPTVQRSDLAATAQSAPGKRPSAQPVRLRPPTAHKTRTSGGKSVTLPPRTGGARPNSAAAKLAAGRAAAVPARASRVCRAVSPAERLLGSNHHSVCGLTGSQPTARPGTAPVLSVARGKTYDPARHRKRPRVGAPKATPTATPSGKPAPGTSSPSGSAAVPSHAPGRPSSGTSTATPTRRAPQPVRSGSSTPRPSSSVATTGPTPTGSRSAHGAGSIRLAAAVGPLHQSPAAGSGPGTYLSPNWVSVGGANAPANLSSGMSAYDPVNDKIVVFGGCRATSSTGGCAPQSTTTLLTATGWSPQSPSVSPPARSAGSMVWDPARQQVVLYGGLASDGTRLQDTWGWTGGSTANWTKLDTGALSPGKRSNASMAYDPDRNGIVLFGGQTSDTQVADNDTWLLSPFGWSKLLAGGSGAPAYRTNAMTTYQGVGTGGQLVLFGGASCASAGCTNPAAVNDTWVLPNSGPWVKQSPSQAPPALSAGAFAYSWQLDASILFGGQNAAGTATNATWAWTGSDWLRAQNGTGAADARYSPMVAVGKNGALNVMGGVIPARSATAPLDRWSYDAKTPVLGVSVSGAVENAATFSTGQVVTVKVVAQNVSNFDLTSTDATSITAALTSGSREVLSAVGSGVTWTADPNDPVPACRSLPGGSAVSSAVAGLIPTVSRAAVNAGCTATESFVAVVVGSPQGCALQTVAARAGNLFGTSADAKTTLPICGNGLGHEDWWTYDGVALGDDATAEVNVANGNLLVKQDDSTPVQSHGDLAFGLGRSYNSQDLLTGNAGQAGILGAGWQFQIGATGAAANGISLGSLIVPTLNSVLDPLSVTYVDRDGTRFVFRPKTPSLDNVSGSLLSATELLGKTSLTSLLQLGDSDNLGQNLKSILNSISGNNGPLLCVDTTYTPPPGADMNLFRFIAFGSGSGASSCSGADPSKGVNIGYSVVRPDRLRYDFNLLGKLSDVVDGAGNTMFYTYDSSNRPSSIYSGSCVPSGQSGPDGAVSGPACKQYSFSYGPTNPSGSRIDVTDPAGRVTTYVVVPANLSTGAPAALTQVWNPDNPYNPSTGTPSVKYTYSATGAPCGGSDATASTIGQLCSATDPLGAVTTFAYTKAPVGPDRVLSFTDRRANSSSSDGGPSRGARTRYTYFDGYTTADTASPTTLGADNKGCAGNAACERTRYASINPVGSVGEIDQGNAADAYLTQTGYFWDSDANGRPCRQPDAVVDYNLCESIERAQPSSAAFVIDKPGTATANGVTLNDQAVRFVYGDLGQVLVGQRVVDPAKAWTADNSATTTGGTHVQYVDAGDKIRAYDDVPSGSGQVDSATRGSDTTYRDAVLTDNPGIYYRFTEPSSTTALADASGNGRTAAYGSNVPRGLPAGVPGDTAVGDPGANEVASATSLADFASGTGDDSRFTIEAWQQTPTADNAYLVCTPCTGGGLIAGRYNGAPSVTLIGDGTGTISVIANASIADNKWHQVDYTYDGSGKAAGVSIYVDGRRVPATTYSDALAGGTFRISGAAVRYGINVNGVANDGRNLADLSLYHAELSASRIAAHYKTISNNGRASAATLYAVADQTAELTPRGNDPANASHWGDFVTTYVRDVPDLDPDTATAAPTPNRSLDADVCGSTVTNTGLVCAEVTPSSDGVAAGDCPSPSIGPLDSVPGNGPHTCTTSTYNTFGEMKSKRTANAHASGSPDKMTFTYYADTGSCTGAGAADCDLSGSVSAGGWLKAVTDQNHDSTDPDGKSVITAYDSAGNAARVWDRNATSGHTLSEAWTNASNPPTSRYTDAYRANAITSASISAGIRDVEIVRGDGTVWGSGNNSQNELGDRTSSGTGTATTTPVRAAGLAGVVQVVQNGVGGTTTGTAATYARTKTGAVYTWGSFTAVKKVGNLPPVISIASGDKHVLVLDNTGTVWAWGANNAGQIGNGTTGSLVATPTKVQTGVAAIAAGSNSSYAVKTDGSVWAWGDNGSGQLATGDTSAKSSPTKSPSLSGVLAVAGGSNTAYAVKADGTVWAWGDNGSGALGTGSAATSVAKPEQLRALGPGTGAGNVRQIVGAVSGAAALMTDGTVRAWGSNNAGQLGSGTANSATPVAVAGVMNQVALAGGASTYLSADRGGALTIWGSTGSGQRGDGTSPATSTPTPTAASQTVTPFASPWRDDRGMRDALGNVKTTVADSNGNVIQSTPARGHAVETSAFDDTATYSANQQALNTLTPMERDGRDAKGALTGVIAATTTDYDVFGNPVAVTDPRGNATVMTYDSANRRTSLATTRATPADAGTTGCNGTASAGANSFRDAQNGHVVCTISTTLDGHGQSVTSTDALQRTTRTTFDALGRAIAVSKPRNDASYTNLTTYMNYDLDDNKVDMCPPRQTSGGSRSTTTCTGSGVYSTHMDFDPAGNAVATTRYRAPDGTGPATALVTSSKFDADGNVVATTDPEGRVTTSTFDLMGRQTSQTTPRSGAARYTTRMRYDAVDNLIATLAPGAAAPGTGANGALTVDGAANPKSNPFRIPDNAQYTSVTLVNGGWISGQNGGLVFTATGAVSVCDTCGITEAGDGQPGGAGGATGTDNGVAGSPVTGGGGPGVGSGGYAGGGGGGGHKTAGADGKGAATAGGAGGAKFGSPDLADIGANYLDASGGGGGGGGHSSLAAGVGAKGGKGGGYIRITADSISVNGSVDASGTAGSNSNSSSGGGGGGGGGTIWLSGDVSVAPSGNLTVAGGAGGSSAAGTTNGYGGSGASGYLRVDTDGDVPAGTDSSGHLANITAYSYDAKNRTVDTVTGSQTVDASDTGAAGVPDDSGLTNTRNRNVYDADGNVVAALPPQAFGKTGSPATLTVNSETAARSDYDLDGRLVKSYDPRWTTATASDDTGAGNDGGSGKNQQREQCTTDAAPSLAPGLAGYSAKTGVCSTTVVYDAGGNAVRQTLPTSNGNDNRYLARTYTDDNLLLTETMPDPTQADGGTARVTDHAYRYDGNDRTLRDTDANGNQTTNAYTADGLTAESAQQCYNVGGTSTGTCTWSGGTTVTHRTLRTFDADGKEITSSKPRAQDPSQSTVSALDAADFTTSTTWTTDGLKASVRAPGLGHGDFDTTTYGYDNVGNQTAVGMPSANATTADASNTARRQTTVQFTDDNLIKVSSTPVSATSYRNTVYSYNPAGQKVATNVCTTTTRTGCPDDSSGADGHGVTRFTYGANGLNVTQVAKATSATPTTIATAYDPAGRVTSVKQTSNGNTQSTVTANYYLDGLLRTADDGVNSNTYAYDGGMHLTSRTDKTAAGGITNGAVKRTSYSYNDAGLLAKMTSDVRAGGTTSVGYDAGGRMTTWTDAGTGTGQTRTYNYLPDDRLAAVTTRATGDTEDRLRYDYAYDNDGNIVKQKATSSTSGAAKSNYTNIYGYNPAANTTKYVHTIDGTATADATASRSTSYTWDHNANRLTANQTTGGNTTNQTWTYRTDNSIATQSNSVNGGTAVSQNYSYNQAGLLTTVTTGSPAVTCTTNTYDDFDRLKTAKDTGAGSCGGQASTVTHTYDGLDRQRTSTTSDTANPTATIYDGLSKTTTGQSKASAGDKGKPSTLYQLSPDGHHVAIWQGNTTSSATSLTDDDSYGNTSLIINTSKTGAAATGCSVDYDPFGNPTAPTAAVASGNGICKTGADAASTANTNWYRDERRDSTTGNYQLGTRTYDPSDGSFATPDNYRVSTPDTDLAVNADPLTMNTFSYVNGNPLNDTDPDGHCPDASYCPSQHPEYKGPVAGIDFATGPAKPKTPHVGDQDVRESDPSKGHGYVKCAWGDSKCFAKQKNQDPKQLVCGMQGCTQADTQATSNYGNADCGNWLCKTLKTVVDALNPIPDFVDCIGHGSVSGCINAAIDVGIVACTVVTAGSCSAAKVIQKGGKLLRDGEKAGKGVESGVRGEKAAGRAADTGDTTVGRGAAKSCPNSFTGDTSVTMADGSTKPIRDVRVGDKVLATDPQTGETRPEPVEQLIRHSGRHAMVLVTLADGSVLDSTDGHLIWDATTGRFTDAGKLHVGDKIETSGRQLIAISGLTGYSADLTAYNLQISTIHTYYAGTTPVLVHNSCGPLTTSQATQMAGRVGYRATNQTFRGQRVFTNGKNYIVQDIDSHSGGLWKMADAVRGLGSKTTRTGTYDYNLNYVGP